jgi:iron complex transport system substrate-binding protein
MSQFFNYNISSLNQKKNGLGFAVLFALLLNSLMALQVVADERIISTDAGVTDVLLALDAGAQLIAVDVTSVVPSEFSVAKIGYHRTLSAEGLISLNPSIIIGSEHMGPPEVIDFIKSSSVKLVQLPAAKDAAQLKQNIDAIGKLIDKTAIADDLLSRVDTAAATLAAQQLASATRVAFILLMDGRSLRLAGTDTVGDNIIKLMGGTNVAEQKAYQAISPEGLINLAPEVIIVAGRGQSDTLAADLLLQHPLLELTPAAKHSNISQLSGRSIIAGISIAALESVALLAKELQ